MKNRIVAVIFLSVIIPILLTPIPFVQGQTEVNIYLVNPQQAGVVGQEVSVQGTIETQNGAYEIWFGSTLVASAQSAGYNVNASFPIPNFSEGNYVIILRDVSKNVNATSPFNVMLSYRIEALEPSTPLQLQEGSTVMFNITITGVRSDIDYYANITVELPQIVNTTYSQVVPLSISAQEATANAQISYPTTNFQPFGSNTNYTGTYKVYLNKTRMLAQDDFFVGFTDSREYHREQTVIMRAIGYQSSQNATLFISDSETGLSVHSVDVTASNQGVITYNWTVPNNTPIGNYNITITTENVEKIMPDSQIFTVPGFEVAILNLNLADEPTPKIRVDAFDKATNITYNGTSGEDGIAILNLEKGNHSIAAFWNEVQVGSVNTVITGESSIELRCALSNIRITVQNENGNLIPFVNIDVTYQYVTTIEGVTKTGHISDQADLQGTLVLSSVLPGISYTLNSSLYGVVFNLGNNTLANLPLQAVYEVTILCPNKILALTVVDYDETAIPNARVELVELTSGIFNGAITNTLGTVTMDITFGKYRAKIYTEDEILLNETVLDVFNDREIKIRCNLYNIKLSIAVVDFFERPIPGVNVLLQEAATGQRSMMTEMDGKATFNNVIGGSVQIITYPNGIENSYEALNLQIEKPKDIYLKMEKYVLLGPMLIEISHMITFLSVLLTGILFFSIEIYKKKRARSDES